MNVFDPALFAVTAPCMPCCGTPTECQCALLFYDYLNPPPPGGDPTPFASYADAASFITSYVFDCLVTCGGATGTTATADFTASVLNVDATGTDISGSNRPVAQWITSIDANTGDTVRVDFSSIITTGGDSGTGTQISAGLTDCAGTFIDPTNSGADFVEWLLTADGPYQLLVSVQGYESGTAVQAVSATSCDGPLTINPLIALWDDSGTTRQLEACPKMLLPPLTESTGDWYADCAAAAADIAAQSSNCVGYVSETPFDSFTATDGGTSLTLAGKSDSGGVGGAMNEWGSVNVEAGETIGISTALVGIGGTAATIYDDTGAVVQSFLGPGPYTSAALPYTGRYTVRCTATGVAGLENTFVITSSGTMSVNPIQALYDVGLTCPARLNCGDSCP